MRPSPNIELLAAHASFCRVVHTAKAMLAVNFTRQMWLRLGNAAVHTGCQGRQTTEQLVISKVKHAWIWPQGCRCRSRNIANKNVVVEKARAEEDT